ncbi:MAG: hypothetical protein ACI4UE_03005 [Candidatus Scatovivens sp.]
MSEDRNQKENELKSLMETDVMKNSKKIREALSYSMGADLHESWRAGRKKEDGTFEPRMKKTKDEKWIKSHGTNEVDIANCTFAELPEDWKKENLEAAKVAVNLVYGKVMTNQDITEDILQEMSSVVHDEWIKRNDWVLSPEYGDPVLARPYAELPESEQVKDTNQLRQAIEKVEAYQRGEIDIDRLKKEYALDDRTEEQK